METVPLLGRNNQRSRKHRPCLRSPIHVPQDPQVPAYPRETGKTSASSGACTFQQLHQAGVQGGIARHDAMDLYLCLVETEGTAAQIGGPAPSRQHQRDSSANVPLVFGLQADVGIARTDHHPCQLDGGGSSG